jgi:hypothetical protein
MGGSRAVRLRVHGPVGVKRDGPGFLFRQVLAMSAVEERSNVPGNVRLGRAEPGAVHGHAAGMLPQGEAEGVPVAMKKDPTDMPLTWD